MLPKYFNLRPKADYEVRLVESFREVSASSGQYQGPSLDGKRPGIFYVNAYDLKARPRSALAALSLHEAAPGHHFQIALQRELTDLPMFRRFSRDTAYIEGWGLYAEYLGYEMGIYKDPVQRFGALDAELWRAIRLVTDTGIHFKGWTRQQTLDYMLANSPAEQTRAVSEAERFAAIPGQALAYKIGQLKFVELRKRAEKALGAKFNVAEFHDEVLKDGAVPLEVLEAKIDRWIAANARLDCAGHDRPDAAERDSAAVAGRRVHAFRHTPAAAPSISWPMETNSPRIIGELLFYGTGTMVTWWLGIHRPIPPANQWAAALVLLSSLALYEWARHTIWGRRFGLGWGDSRAGDIVRQRPIPLHPPSYLPWLRARLPGRAGRVASLDVDGHIPVEPRRVR